MQRTPKSLRMHIGLFGRRNVGKSSLLNALTRQDISIVSDVAGTTTDPVEKAMELLPVGPVLFIDTAGIDDEGALGGMRIERTRKVYESILKYNFHNPGRNNHQSWFNAAYANVGVAIADPKLINTAIYGKKGLYFQLQNSVTRDGFWFEGTIAYHFYALQAIIETVNAVKRA